MLGRIAGQLSRGKKITGVAVTFKPDGEEVVSVTLELSSGMVYIRDKKKWANLKDAVSAFQSRNPIALVLDGRGILHRHISHQDSVKKPDDLHISSILPTINPNDFYIQTYVSRAIASFSVVRKDTIDQLLEYLKGSGAEVIDVTLGPFVFANLLPFIDQAETGGVQGIDLGSYLLDVEAKRIVAVTSNQADPVPSTDSRSIRIGGEELETEFALPYAVALTNLVNAKEGPVIYIENIQGNVEEFKQKRVFYTATTAALGFFFTLLMLNFIVYSQLSDKRTALQLQVNTDKSSLKEAEQLQTKVKEKREFLQAAGWLENGKTSFLADRLAATVPAGIRLQNLNVYPLDEKLSKEKQKALFEHRFILVEGLCTNPVELNSWIEDLQSERWVEQVDRQRYTYDNAKGDGNFEFRITVKTGTIQ